MIGKLRTSAPFRYSSRAGRAVFERDQGDAEYARFVAGTGITLTSTCGINTSPYDHEWRGVSPRVEVVKADFTARTPPSSRTGQVPAHRLRRGTPAGQLALVEL